MGMKRKKKVTASKGKSRKASIVKLSNKHLNKLAKQGKLRKKVPKRELLKLLKDRTTGTKDGGQEVDDNQDVVYNDELPLENEDVEYFQDKDFGFLLNLKSEDNSLTRKRKKKSDDQFLENDELEQTYEKKAFITQAESKPMKALLPIKSKEKGIETRMIEAEEDEEGNVGEDDENTQEEEDQVEEEKEPLPVLSTAELFVRRQQKVQHIKQKIASLASSLIESPEENVNKLRELRLILEINDPEVLVTSKKLTVISLLEVFKDILPGYAIRLATEKEKEQSASKETKTLREYEETLLRNYKNYLEALEALSKGQKLKTKDKKKSLEDRVNGVQIPPEAVQDLKAISVRCMLELLVSHPHFNFRQTLVNIAIPFIGHKKAALSDMVCGYVKRIFKEDRSGELTLEVVRCISKVIKNCRYDVHPKVVHTFLSLKIKEVDQGDKDDKKEHKKNNRFISRRDKKRKKQMKELEKELEEAAAVQNKKKKLKTDTEIINSVFLTYFRILKLAPQSVCLSAVLEGLAKFAHLINVTFFDDLFTVINDLVESGDLTYRECLHCIKTAFIILSGQGSSLNIDPLHFYQHLYANLFNLTAGETSEDVEIALECLDIMITKRRKQISQQRLIGFIKRLTTLALQLPADGALGCLASARSFIVSDSKSEILYDTDHEGTGMYMPELLDPEHCNAHNTALFDLHLARHHYHPMVRKYSDHLLGGCSSNLNSILGDDTRKSATELYQAYSQHNVEFNPALLPKPKVVKKLRIQKDFLQEDVQSLCTTYNEQYDVDINKLAFHKGLHNYKKEKQTHKVYRKRKKTAVN